MNSNVLELPQSSKPPELITESYREQNAELHRLRPDYGVNGHKHAPQIRELAMAIGAQSILDYGCGKGTLADALENMKVINYDPAFEQWATTPEPSDLVVCGDVMEHIEPECLDAVLDDLARVTKKCLFANIATRPAVKTLPDGRNAHLIQKDYVWWVNKMASRFTIGSFHNMGGEVLMVCGAKQ